jgi:hypothetical protein
MAVDTTIAAQVANKRLHMTAPSKWYKRLGLAELWSISRLDQEQLFQTVVRKGDPARALCAGIPL